MLKKLLVLALCLLPVFCFADEELTIDGNSDISVRKQSVLFYEKPANPGSPSANGIKLYAKDKAGVTTLYTKDSAGNVVEIGAAGAGSGDNVTVNSTAIDTTANIKDSTDITWAITDGGAGGPDDIKGTIADSVSVTSWNLTTPTITTSLVTSTPTTLTAAELDRLDGLTSPIIDDDKIDTSAELYGILTDETGSTSGTPLAVFSVNPTLTGVTMAGALTLGENGIVLDPTISADGQYSGITESGTAGATLAFGDLVYLNNDDSRWELVDANLSDGYDKKLGICVLVAAADGNATTILLYGKVNAATVFPALTVGAPAYISETAGDIVLTAPVTTDSATRIIGFCNSADELMFNPENSYYTHT
jgi:hypothetical protein